MEVARLFDIFTPQPARAMSETPRKRDRAESSDPPKRELRSRTRAEEASKKAASSKTQHFGEDVTPEVTKAMSSGRKLDEESRRGMQGRIKRSSLTVSDPSKVLGPEFGKQLVDQYASKTPIVQQDDRVDPRKGGSYPGFMMTSSIVSSKSFDPGFKEIPAPSSPNPYKGEGYYHASHASPFALVGPESNKVKTVNAPSWANITVDGGIEKEAHKAVEKFGEGEVIHFRLDSHDRSTVGYAKHDVSASSEEQRWEVVAAQYQRKREET
jgi:hypothetical protein